MNVIHPYKTGNRWVFKHGTRVLDLAPAGIMDAVLSPLIIGVDKLISLGCQKKNIPETDKGFTLLFSEQFFPNADVKLDFKEIKYNGWIYGVEGLGVKDVMPGQATWICPYMSYYYPEPPKVLYLKIEQSHE